MKPKYFIAIGEKLNVYEEAEFSTEMYYTALNPRQSEVGNTAS